jgi:histidyl-tRNA synthetase
MSEARTLKGFRDFRGNELRIRKAIFRIFEETFEKYGYEPLETPVLEYADYLLEKYGEEEKLVYQFEDHGGRKVAMRYDLTVPAARVLATYANEVPLPWKRYQIQPVWRADNTQKGRFREFYQLDADTFGIKSPIVDAEFIDMGVEIIKKLGFKDFEIRINNRKILNAIAKYVGREDKAFDIVYAIDKWDKRSPQETREDLKARLSGKQFSDKEINTQIDKIFSCVQLEGGTSAKLAKLKEQLGSIPEGLEGVEELETILRFVQNKEYLRYDPTIARGLAYYTGPIWEWNILEGGVGSIGGCGRYDKLVSQFLGRDIPATGGSFGIERILEVMKDRKMLARFLQKQKFIIVCALSEVQLKYAYDVSQKLRESGLKIMLYPEVKKLEKVIDYALKKEFDSIVILGENEQKTNQLTLKDLSTREQITASLDKVIIQINNG